MKKRKKSLVGWLGKAWYWNFKAYKGKSMDYFTHETMAFYKNKQETTDVKVRITIEEI